MNNEQGSARFNLDIEDAKAILRNFLTFWGLAILAFLVALQTGASLSDALIIFKFQALNTVVDFLRKWLASNES